MVFFSSYNDNTSTTSILLILLKQRSKLFYVVSFVVIYIILNTFIPIFDYDRLLPPLPYKTEVTCLNRYTNAEQHVKEGFIGLSSLSGGGSSSLIKLNLFTISIIRRIECYFTYEYKHLFSLNEKNTTLTEKEKEEQEQRLLFNITYRDDFLNISDIDKDKMIHDILFIYPIGQPFIAWYYRDDCFTVREDVDENCLSKIPLDVHKYDSIAIYIILKVFNISIVLLILIIHLWLCHIYRNSNTIHSRNDTDHQV